jgi:hypothetical protein
MAAMAEMTVNIKPDEETLAEIAELRATVEALSEGPFNHELIQPYVTQAAELVAQYYYKLLELKVPTNVVDVLVFEFHQVLWGIAPSREI